MVEFNVHPKQRGDASRLSGRSTAVRVLQDRIERIAPTGASVMIAGESGVGKDIVARCLHALSAHRDGPFVPVNCGAIPADIADAQLFGHEKGVSPARSRGARAFSKRRAAARCCSTKSPKCLRRCR
jgi:DNA-binding NtrC family response regulator